MRKLKILITLSIIVFAFMGCNSCHQKTVVREKKIKIGIITPLTGDVATWGAMQKRATDLALEEINDSNITVIYEDDKADPSTGVSAMNKLINIDKVNMIVGSPASNVTLAIAPILNEKKVPLLSSGSTATKVGDAGPYIFRIMPSDEIQSLITVDWAIALGKKRVSVVYVQNAWGEGLKEAFLRDFPKKGGQIQEVYGVAPNSIDFKTILQKIKENTTDAIYAPLYPKEAGILVKQIKELGIESQVFGADVYDTPEFITAGGSASNGILYTTFGQYTGTEFEDFSRKYKERYGIEVENYAVYCYDAFKIAVEAINKSTHLDGENIRKSILQIKDYKGATGISNFDGNNNASGKTFDKKTIKEGKSVIIE
ncbi:MAG: Leu/Ile/Val-binding protein [Bacteroidia bacterium]|nr:Leu/Ile/Val-binding protein [Bacteroidia bacterium]